jgi:hypothetical protein
MSEPLDHRGDDSGRVARETSALLLIAGLRGKDAGPLASTGAAGSALGTAIAGLTVALLSI